MSAAPYRLQELADIEAAIWHELALATGDRQHGWRTPVLASADGEGVDARTVVLREVDGDASALAIYTDSRAAKVRQLQAQPACTLVMWSADLGWQLRLRCQVVVHTDGLAVSSRWVRLRATPAARDYLSPLAPGTAIEDMPGTPQSRAPAQSSAATQREFFAVLVASVEAIDWLELHAQGHRRARFTATQAQWLVP